MEKQSAALESKEKTKKLFSSMPRALIKAGIPMATAILMATACSQPEAGVPTKTPTPAPTKSGETFVPQYISIISKYYPELRKSGLQPQESESLHADQPFWIPTTIFNYTEYPLNKESISSIYVILEGIARANSEVKIPYTLNGSERMLALLPNNEAKNRVTVLMPPNAPRPNNIQALGATATSPNDSSALEEVFSYIIAAEDNDELFTNDKERATRSLATEICQQVVRVTVLDKNGEKVKKPEEIMLAREIICNSLGLGIGAKQIGIPYPRYRDYVTKHDLGYLNGVRAANLYIVLDEYTYSQFPTDGTVLK